MALFHNYPSLRMESFGNTPSSRRCFNWHEALLGAQFPLRIVFEEDLEKGLPEEIDALVVPEATFASPETVRAVERFLRKGGQVIGCQCVFARSAWTEREVAIRPDSPSERGRLPLAESPVPCAGKGGRSPSWSARGKRKAAPRPRSSDDRPGGLQDDLSAQSVRHGLPLSRFCAFTRKRRRRSTSATPSGRRFFFRRTAKPGIAPPWRKASIFPFRPRNACF